MVESNCRVGYVVNVRWVCGLGGLVCKEGGYWVGDRGSGRLVVG